MGKSFSRVKIGYIEKKEEKNQKFEKQYIKGSREKSWKRRNSVRSEIVRKLE